MKYHKYIHRAEVRKTSELKYHNDLGPGKRYVFLDKRKLPETSLYTIVRSATDVFPTQPEYVGDHSHFTDSCFLFIGDGRNLKGLKAEVMLDGEKFVVESPASVFIPKEINHSYRLIQGSGKFINVVLHGDYNEATR